MNEINNVSKKVVHPIQYSNKKTNFGKIMLFLDLKNGTDKFKDAIF